MTKKKKQTLKFTYNYSDDPKDKRTDTYVGEVKNGVFPQPASVGRDSAFWSWRLAISAQLRASRSS